MDHSNNSENDIMHSILCVKLEPFAEDDDCTQKLDPLEANGNVHTEFEVLQVFKTEIETDDCGQAMNELIQENILKNDPGDTETKIKEINIKTEYIANEASVLDDILDSHRIIEDYSPQIQLGENGSSIRTEHGCIEISNQPCEKNATKYELSHSYEAQLSDVIMEESTNDANLLNVTSLVDHSSAGNDSSYSGVNFLRAHKHSTSEEGSKDPLIVHSLLHPSYVCDTCNKEFKNLRTLVGHKRIHTSGKPHVCEVCKKGFSKTSDLVRHKRIHTGEKPYVCDTCKKEFNQFNNLVTHRRVHTGEKPYTCDICQKRFTSFATLATHKRVHTGEKPYSCDICKIRFSDSSALVKHKRIHTGQKPYLCDICKKEFNQSSALVTHKRIHTGQKPYVCDNCKKGFSNSSDLLRHKRTHTRQKPYVCDICKKGFSNSSDLLRHKRIHTGQKT